MVDKDFCMSSFLALRYTEKFGVDFTEKLPYRHPSLPLDSERISVKTAEEIGQAIKSQLDTIRGGVQEDRYIAIRRHGFINFGFLPSRV